ncbi:HAMP domain-containing histidine kinase [bacterium]|nr:HAMP domain-containing histidine kinase [bacterium]MBU1958202.1 HAMP domain-containing histidine kinase [bacterium]
MLQGEKRSLFRFLGIYLSSTFLLFFLATFIFYNFQKHQIIDAQNAELDLEAKRISQQLRNLNETFTTPLIYPQQKPFYSAIYNLDKAYIFGSFQPKNIVWESEYYQLENQLFHIHALYPYYLGASHLVISRTIDQKPINDLMKILLLFLFIAGIFFTLLGLFLGKLFIAPMKESLERMNRFIEDTTHEFNTPISTILTNIELLDTLYDCEGKQEMQRIEIASKTLSRLYEDLTYLKLNHNYHREIERLNVSQLLENRIEYFNTLIEAKNLDMTREIDEDVFLTMDKNDAIRLMDNLLSNAVKYNIKKGLLNIHLSKEKLTIYNSGIGIKKKNIDLIHGRFKRANKNEGGFGIGLDIVGQVVERYDFTFKIDSNYKEHTEVTVLWKK